MIREWLEEYKPANQEAAEQALREIMHEIALAAYMLKKQNSYPNFSLQDIPTFTKDHNGNKINTENVTHRVTNHNRRHSLPK